jgi:hypothetical protein
MNITEVINNILLCVTQDIFDWTVMYNFDNGPMLKLVLAFVPALIGVAYPLIIQTISKLNDQYNSTHIIERIKKRKIT